MSSAQAFYSAFVRIDTKQPIKVIDVKKLENWIEISLANGIATEGTKNYLQIYFGNVPFEISAAEKFMGSIVRVSRIQMPDQPYRLTDILGILETHAKQGWFLGIGHFGARLFNLKDLTHAQVYGASGFGKSTFFRFLLGQTLAAHDDCMNFIIDPKQVDYAALSGHPRVAAVATTVEQWTSVFAALVIELSMRERLFASSFASPPTSLDQYREFKKKFKRDDLPDLPRIMVWIDEAHMVFRHDLHDEFMSDAPAVLVKKARAFGMHLIVSSQRPGDVPSSIRSQASTVFLFYLSDANATSVGVVDRFSLKMKAVRGRLQSYSPAEDVLYEVQTPNATSEEALALAFGRPTSAHSFPTAHGLLPLDARPDLIADFRLAKYFMEGRSIAPLLSGAVDPTKMKKPRVTFEFQYPHWYGSLHLSTPTAPSPAAAENTKEEGEFLDSEIMIEFEKYMREGKLDPVKDDPTLISVSHAPGLAKESDPVAAPSPAAAPKPVAQIPVLRVGATSKTANVVDAAKFREIYLKFLPLSRSDIHWCHRDLRQNEGLRAILKSMHMDTEVLEEVPLLKELAMTAVNKERVVRYIEDMKRWEAGGRAPLLVLSGRPGMGKRTIASVLAAEFNVKLRDRTDADLVMIASKNESPALDRVLGAEGPEKKTVDPVAKAPVREMIVFETLTEAINYMRHGSSMVACVLIIEKMDGFFGSSTTDIGYLKEHHYHFDLKESDYREVAVVGDLLKTLYRRHGLKGNGPSAGEFFSAGVAASPAAMSAIIARAANRSLIQDRAFDVDVMKDVLATFRTENQRTTRRVDIIVPEKSMNDLIIGEHTRSDLLDVIFRAKSLSDDSYEFVSKLRKKGRMIALFCGPPGTGKSMSAEVIAKECGKELWVVDMSRLLGSFVGETEAALSEIFQTSSAAGSVLLLDEADAFLGARSGFQTEHGRRWVNHLLNLMENHHGVLILTTNHPDALDSAFSRRIDVKAMFEAPDDAQLAEMARRLLYPDAPLTKNFDFVAAVKGLGLSGGLLRNGLERAYLKMRRLGLSGLTTESVRAALHETMDENSLMEEQRRTISLAP